MHYVCSTSVDLLADSEKFPEHWLFKHRWGKGNKNAPAVLPNGEKIIFITVGGRTSAVVPSVQKKSGAVTKEDNDESADGTQSNSKRKRAAPKEKTEPEEDEEEAKPKRQASKKQTKKAVKTEGEDEESKEPAGRRRSTRTRK